MNVIYYFIVVTNVFNCLVQSINFNNTEPCLSTDVYPDMVCDPLDLKLANASATDVKFQLFTSPDQIVGKYYSIENIGTFPKKLKGRPSKFIIHGWLSNEDSVWFRPLKDAFYTRYRLINVFYVDWSKAGSLSYPVSAANTSPIGRFIADMIIRARLDPKLIHIVGHSLGSHVASSIGKVIFQRTRKKILRLTATDPARPMFEALKESKFRLAKSDAQFVQVIHTDVDHYGLMQPLGHVDYYPNGGKNQPECPPLKDDDNCSHAMSNRLFIDILKKYRKYKCWPAKNWDSFVAGKYTRKSYWFGSTLARGNLYFKTTP